MCLFVQLLPRAYDQEHCFAIVKFQLILARTAFMHDSIAPKDS